MNATKGGPDRRTSPVLGWKEPTSLRVGHRKRASSFRRLLKTHEKLNTGDKLMWTAWSESLETSVRQALSYGAMAALSGAGGLHSPSPGAGGRLQPRSRSQRTALFLVTMRPNYLHSMGQ